MTDIEAKARGEIGRILGSDPIALGRFTQATEDALVALVTTARAEAVSEERAMIARFISLYDTWCAGWGMTRNQSAANEAAREIAEMIGKWDWSVPIPDDDDAAEDHIARIVRGWHRKQNEERTLAQGTPDQDGGGVD